MPATRPVVLATETRVGVPALMVPPVKERELGETCVWEPVRERFSVD